MQPIPHARGCRGGKHPASVGQRAVAPRRNHDADDNDEGVAVSLGGKAEGWSPVPTDDVDIVVRREQTPSKRSARRRQNRR
jgi:hypothetical protein